MHRFGRPVGNTDSLSFLYGDRTNGVTENNEVYPDVAQVDSVELYAVENSTNHRTDKYELVQDDKTPVLRRADFFYLALKAQNRQLDLDSDEIKLVFDFGYQPSVPKGTKVVLIVTNKYRLDNDKAMWDVIVHSYNHNSLILKIQISSLAPVGAWKCRIETTRKADYSKRSNGFQVSKPIYILFNPYSKDDSVYYPNEAELAEYIQNDVGKVWKGTYKKFQGRHWVFGQFEDVVLPACCMILDRSYLKPGERGNPVRVARAIAAMINSVDDGGVVEGRWAAPYDEGTAPWDWNGSVEILEEYVKSEGKPVKYVCRALGIPCRSVTNYVSAHDTNHSVTIDKFFDENGEELTSQTNPDIGHDSIWNFHVWNDVWMARPDLPIGYGGWQAIDATPQEISGSTYQCGPAPVEAIRKGEIGLSFDVGFLFAEVNADICHFVQDPSSPWGFSRTKLNSYHVGRLVLTKGVGLDDGEGDLDAEDITWQYKNSEGTPEERLAVYNAVSSIDKSKRYYQIPSKDKEDVLMDLVELDKVAYGQPYKARVTLQNRSREQRTIKALLSSSSIYYFGVTANPISKAQGEFTLAPGQRDTLALTIYPEDYMDKLVDYCMIKLYSLIKVKETNQIWSDEDDFVLEKPGLAIEIPERLQRGRLGTVVVSFKNPLQVALGSCRVSIKAPGIVREIKENIAMTTAAGSWFQHKFLVNPRKAGKASFVATFSSDQMFDLYGSKSCQVYA